MSLAKTIRNNISQLIERSGTGSQNGFAKHCGLPQRTINKVFLNDAELPTTKTLIAIAERNGVEAWMMLVRDFPWDAVGHEKMDHISSQGYLLLKAFERSTPDTKKAILSQMAFLLKNDENKERESMQLMESKAQYSQSRS